MPLPDFPHVLLVEEISREVGLLKQSRGRSVEAKAARPAQPSRPVVKETGARDGVAHNARVVLRVPGDAPLTVNHERTLACSYPQPVFLVVHLQHSYGGIGQQRLARNRFRSQRGGVDAVQPGVIRACVIVAVEVSQGRYYVRAAHLFGRKVAHPAVFLVGYVQAVGGPYHLVPPPYEHTAHVKPLGGEALCGVGLEQVAAVIGVSHAVTVKTEPVNAVPVSHETVHCVGRQSVSLVAARAVAVDYLPRPAVYEESPGAVAAGRDASLRRVVERRYDVAYAFYLCHLVCLRGENVQSVVLRSYEKPVSADGQMRQCGARRQHGLQVVAFHLGRLHVVTVERVAAYEPYSAVSALPDVTHSVLYSERSRAYGNSLYLAATADVEAVAVAYEEHASGREHRLGALY